MGWEGPLERVSDNLYRIPRSYRPEMRVPGLIFADEVLIEEIRGDQAPEQVANVAALPGIVGYSIAMPDIHLGYGFPIGGVAAMDIEDGVVSPGGVGYDINCGVRLLSTSLEYCDVAAIVDKLIDSMYAHVPVGVGKGGSVRLTDRQLMQVLADGATWAVAEGRGEPSDLEQTEEGGVLEGADPDMVSKKARQRGLDQLGTLGSGNHFLELSVVDEVYDRVAAGRFGLEQGAVTVMIHSGSRGLGHQVCTDYLRAVELAAKRYGIAVEDRQLACAPIASPEGRQYIAAMAGAANYAWANRQWLTHLVREALSTALRVGPERLGIQVVYDQAHNIAKFERHQVQGNVRDLCVHRKGAARALPAGHPHVPAIYRDVGQPVLVPGDMARGSYVLVGGPRALDLSFGSACHGAGRRLSRGAAKRSIRGDELRRTLSEQGVTVRSASDAGLAEEAPSAYKDIDRVVDITHRAGLALRVARLKPLAVIKG